MREYWVLPGGVLKMRSNALCIIQENKDAALRAYEGEKAAILSGEYDAEYDLRDENDRQATAEALGLFEVVLNRNGAIKKAQRLGGKNR